MSETKTYKKETVGEQIAQLVREHTGKTIGVFILEQALEQVKENNQKLEAYKESLFATEVRE